MRGKVDPTQAWGRAQGVAPRELTGHSPVLADGERWRTGCSLEFKLIAVQSDQLVGKKNKVS